MSVIVTITFSDAVAARIAATFPHDATLDAEDPGALVRLKRGIKTNEIRLALKKEKQARRVADVGIPLDFTVE